MTQFGKSVDQFGQDISEIDVLTKRTLIKEAIQDLLEQPLWSTKVAILSGQEFDDIGIARTSAIKAVAQAFNKSRSEVEDDVDEAGSVTDAVRDYSVTWDTQSDDLEDLYADIQDLEDERGDRQLGQFARLMQRYSTPWVVSFAVVGGKNIGISHKTICAAAGEKYGYSQDEITRGRALYPDSVEFVKQVKNGREVGKPEVGKAFRPMKAKSIGLPDNPDDWVAQIKLDGYRSIIHVDHGDVRAYSAAMNEQTGVLPELDDIDWPAGEWIFDSEVMASDGEYSSTSERMQRKEGSHMPHTMNFWVFDVLVAEGRDITRQPFEQRLNLLIERAPMDERVVPVFAHEEIEDAREQALDEGYEGVILKRKDHEFEFGKRSQSWIKDKITTETVDLRVDSVKQGTGRHTDRMGALALRTEDGVNMGRVGTGFSDKQRLEIWENRSEWLDSIVEIKFDADQGYQDGLRFPAYVGPRPDKAEADDLQRVKNIAGDN